MPEMFFDIRWPDDASDTCYSPSSIISTHLEANRTYTVRDFVAACRCGLSAASDRVREVYGGQGCARALAQLAAIEAKAGGFANSDMVHVERIGTGLRKSA